MSDHDPIAELIARLPNDPVSAELRGEVERRARGTFERETGRFARFDRWMLGRVAPAVLSLCVLASAFDLVRYFTRVFGRAGVAAASGQAGVRPSHREADLLNAVEPPNLSCDAKRQSTPSARVCGGPDGHRARGVSACGLRARVLCGRRARLGPRASAGDGTLLLRSRLRKALRVRLRAVELQARRRCG